MAEKPRCRLCGARHWSHEVHQWTEQHPVTRVTVGYAPGSPIRSDTKITTEMPEKDQIIAELQTILAKKRKAKAAQMRRYRAKKRGKDET